MRRIYAIIAIAVSCLVLTTCKKDKEPVPPVFEFNEVEAVDNSAEISGWYEYEGELKNLTLVYGRDSQLVDAKNKDVDVEGKNFRVTVDDLDAETKYYFSIECKTTYSSMRTKTESFMTTKSVSLAEVTTNDITAITETTATCGGNVTDDGNATVTARGVCWSASQNPTINDNKTTDGSGTGSYTSNISNLSENTKYYVRAYATNEKGTSYGEEKSFMTMASEGLPTVTTNNVTDITTNSATSGGNVTDDGNATVTAKGICWSTTPNPTIENEHTEDGTGIGSYVSYMTELNHGTKYYVRAYATNRAGTAYGEQKEFTTEVNEELPIVTTNDITAITETTATSGGNVTSDGNATVTARGVCWSTSQNPTINDNKTTDGSGTGSYTSNISNLTHNTKYYVRAYATNEKGTAYGEQKEFTTLVNELMPVVTTNEVTNVSQTTATCGGNVTSDGNATVTARGVCWSTSQNPTINDNKTTDGSGTGSYISNLSNLTPNTTYYVRAYATNNKGTSYGEQKSFKTHQVIELPTVTTADVTNVGETTATSGGNVTSDGNATVTARGVCWSTSQNPTINDNKTTDGNGTGSYTSNISNLSENTTYYVRAYATNEKGTSYGEQKSFTTLQNIELPTVTTNNVTNITTNSATSGGNVTSDGGANVTARGVCWSTSQNPTISNSHTTDGNGTGSFTSNMTGLTANTTYYVRAYATNEKGTSYGEQKSFKTLQNIELPTVTTTNVSNITQTTATSGGNVTSNGGANVTARGVCWSTSQNPTISNSHTTDGTGTGSFTSSITGLTANTTYYVRAYATNEKGTSYGEQKTFTTLQNIELPTVTTTNVSNITQTTATSGGNVTSDGGANVTARGVCWSTSQNPTISNSHTTDGNGTGSFTSNMTGLTANTTYYVRAYATNEKGTAYGEQKSFTTLQNIELPTVTTTNVSNITQTTATSGGNVTSDGGANVTARGVCWSTSQNPTISNSHTTDGNGTGSFTSNMTGLTANTTYYVRAYATNEKGTAYGEQRSFTTLEEDLENQVVNINGVSFTMIKVEGGTFQMGAQDTDPNAPNYDIQAYDKESPVHSVTLSDYYIGETEVTQELWEAVMGSNPSHFSGNPQRPVEKVSWNDCKEFITNLNNLTGMNFRLPTEAEWEYAARGGNESQGYKYSGSNTIGNVAWYGDNSGSATHNVKTKSPNELGIYDMSGNVWEWCEDWFGDYSSGSQTNPTGPSSGSYRVLRGGSWGSYAGSCRVSYRIGNSPGYRDDGFGFRVVCFP